MALIKCEECGRDVSDRADSCPACGFPIDQLMRPQSSQPTPTHRLKALLGGIAASGLFIQPHIPREKLVNAISAFGQTLVPNDVELLYDSTMFGSAKTGILVTAESISWRNDDRSINIPFSEIEYVGFKVGLLGGFLMVNSETTHVESLEVASAIGNVVKYLVRQKTHRHVSLPSTYNNEKCQLLFALNAPVFGWRLVSLGFKDDPDPVIRITHIFPGGSAEKAGVREEDVLVSLDSQRIGTIHDYSRLKSGYSVGDNVRIGICRGFGLFSSGTHHELPSRIVSPRTEFRTHQDV